MRSGPLALQGAASTQGAGADVRVLGEASTEKEPLQLDLKGQRDASWTRQRLSQLEGAA